MKNSLIPWRLGEVIECLWPPFWYDCNDLFKLTNYGIVYKGIRPVPTKGRHQI
jgi:hypothetical protein